MAASGVQMWVDYEPFCFGVIQAHAKLSKVYLKKVMTYARSKGADGGFPKLSWSVWRHMAMNKMLFPESSAWTYFDLYNAIADLSREQRLEEAELMQQSYENDDQDAYKRKVKVDTFGFVLHLYLQQSSKMSLRTSLVGEEWPRSSPRTRSHSPDSIDSPKMTGAPSILEEGNRLSFVMSHLTDMIELISEPEQLPDQNKIDRRLSLDAVKALGCIIKAYLPKTESVVPLHALATKHRFQNKSGYFRSTNDFSCRAFENWLRSSLESSPFATGAMLDSGTMLPWTMPSRQKTAMKRCRIASTALSGYRNTILFFSCSEQTICQQSALLNGASIKLIKCNNLQVYLLSPLRSVSIEKCHNSTFVFGPISKCIRVTGCGSVTVVSPCRSFIVSSSNNVTTHVATPSQPVVIGESLRNSGSGDNFPMVTLAPYHTYYDRLETHLADIGLVISPQIDKWNNPACLSHALPQSHSRGSFGHAKLPKNHLDETTKKAVLYRILAPSEFFSFVIPFQSTEKLSKNDLDITRSIPWGLPEEYQEAVSRRRSAVRKYKSAVKSADMTKLERRKFQSRVETRFKEWLDASGNRRQLDDLVVLSKSYDETSSSN